MQYEALKSNSKDKVNMTKLAFKKDVNSTYSIQIKSLQVRECIRDFLYRYYLIKAIYKSFTLNYAKQAKKSDWTNLWQS